MLQIINKWAIDDLYNKKTFNIEASTNHIIYYSPQEPYTDFAPPEEFIPNLIRKSISLDVVLNAIDVNKLPQSENITYHTWISFFIYWVNLKMIAHNKDLINYSNYLDTKVPTSLFTLLVNKPHPHRCKLIDKLGQDLVNSNIVGWKNINKNFEFKNWKQQILVVDSAFSTTRKSDDVSVPDTNTMFTSNVHGNSDSVLTLVSETTPDILFLTEKTFIPISLGKPVLIVGAKGINKFLTAFGFKLYENIIDYSFDEEESYDTRIEMIQRELTRLSTINFETLKQACYPTSLHNKERFYHIIKNKEYFPTAFTEKLTNINLKYNSDYTNIIKQTIF